MLTGTTLDAPQLPDIFITPRPLVLEPSQKFMAASTEEELGRRTFAHPVPRLPEKHFNPWRTSNGSRKLRRVDAD